MGPNEKRGRVKMQLSAAAGNLGSASEGLRGLGNEYQAIAVMLDAAGQVLKAAAMELNAMREREDEAERKG